jgi:hypothetical protein
MDGEKPSAIRLSGSNILDEHCYFENVDSVVTIHSMPGSITVSASQSISEDSYIYAPLQLLNGKQVEPEHVWYLPILTLLPLCSVCSL